MSIAMEKSKKDASLSKKQLSEYQRTHKRAERERARIQKERQREAERKKKQEEKELRLKEKQMKKEEEERLKEERRLKRMEEQKKREEEREAERKRKEEDKRKKEEERLQKEQERLQKEQEKKKEEEFKTKCEEKQRAVLLGFLVKGEQKKESPADVPSSGPFMQFELRKDMRMAPIRRVSGALLQQKRSNLDELLASWIATEKEDTASSLGLRKFGRTNYLHELRTKQHIPLSSGSTWPVEPLDIEYLGDGLGAEMDPSLLKRHGTRGTGGTVCLRAKLFQFVENYRPAYYGTWRRRSRTVTGRRPFARDEKQLDYSVDSDDEWEEEEPGESITQSENEEEEEEKEEGEDEEEDDDQFFVPHGYLSDDEGVGAEDAEEDAAAGEEMKKLRQRLSAAEYEMAHRRGMQRLKPLLVGPVWLPDPVQITSSGTTNLANELDENKENVEYAGFGGTNPMSAEKSELQTMRLCLNVYRMHIWDGSVPIHVQLDAVAPPAPLNRRTRRTLPEEAIPYLIHLVHKSPLGKLKLAFEFRVFWHRHTTGKLPDCVRYDEYKKFSANSFNANNTQTGAGILSGPAWDSLALSQSLVLAKLSEIAVFEEGRWAVHPDVLRRFGSRLQATCGIKEVVDLGPNADDASLAAIVFPSWQFLSDVAAITLKSNRLSAAKRRSLEVPLTDSELDRLKDAVQTVNHAAVTVQLSSPRVVLQPLLQNGVLESGTNDHSSSKTECLQLTEANTNPTSTHSRVKCSQTSETSSTISLQTSQPKNDSSPVISSSLTSVARKRVTLDNFFTPPSKRACKNSDESEIPCIVIDSD
ncbi:unnamed protein product [Calicophoron daubneyi]|uniref:Chromatin assembly factor 1 subunit A n=1 Tax=Calicophoron daubneyi TaxID=300641 RepID=A0AAV2TCE5_CALDB